MRCASGQKMGLIDDAKIWGRCAVEGCKGGRALVRAREGIECQDHEAQRAAHWPCCYRTGATCIDLHRYRCLGRSRVAAVQLSSAWARPQDPRAGLLGRPEGNPRFAHGWFTGRVLSFMISDDKPKGKKDTYLQA